MLAPSITIYGSGGTSGANYTVTIDPSSTQPFTQSYSQPGTGKDFPTERIVIYNSTELTYAPHQLKITNNGPGLLLDVAVLNLQLGADE